MKSPTQVEKAINSILQERSQDTTGTGKARSRSLEIKGTCKRFPLERLHNGILYLEGKVQALERYT